MALYLEKMTPNDKERHLADVAASFQEAVVDILVQKSVAAARERNITDVTLSGGVAANSRLRELMTDQLGKFGKRLKYPSLALCTDNAAMIAAAGYFRVEKYEASEFVIDATPYLPLVQPLPEPQ